MNLYDFLKSQSSDFTTGDTERLVTETIVKNFKNFDDFKNVKKINILSLPIYRADTKTGDPFESLADSDFLGGTWRPVQTQTYLYDPKNDKIEFNEIVDIYIISLTPKMYSCDKLGYGVWYYPTTYYPNDFSSLNKIEINFSIEEIKELKNMNDEEAKTEAKRVILKQVSELIDSGQSNLPCEQKILIRCSPRSIKINNNNEEN